MSFTVDNGSPILGNGTSDTTIVTLATASRTLTIPDITCTLVCQNDIATITNKTLTSNTNNIIARELWVGSGASSVSTYAATAPSAGQVLTATASNTATWQTPVSADTFSGSDTLGGVNISSGWTDIPIDTEHVKTSNMVHSANSAEITVNRTGTFQFNGFVSIRSNPGTNSAAEARLVVNTGSGYTEVIGTRVFVSTDTNNEDDRGTGTFSLSLSVVSGYKYKLQAQRINGSATMETLACSGININTIGAQGATGATGATGPTGSGSNVIIKDEGTNITNTPHSALNFTGAGVSVTDGGSGTANISINGGFGTSTITYIGSASNGGVNLSSISINVPSGTTRDCVMICHMTVRSNTNPIYGYATPPAGWRQISTQSNTDNTNYWRTLYVWAKWASSSEPASYTWTSIGPASNFVCGGISTYTGVAAFNIINAEAAQSTPSSLSHDVPAITTTVANTMLVGYVSYASCATSWTLSGGTTQSFMANSETPPQLVGEGCIAFRKFQASIATVGGPGAFTVTASNDADNGLSDLLALTPGFNTFTPPNVGALDFGLTNATLLNMGNQNAPTNMYDLTLCTGYPTNIPLKIIGAGSQSANMFEIKNASNSLISGIDSVGKLIITNSSSGEVQYNDNGKLSGTSKLLINSDGNLTLVDINTTPSAPSENIKLFSRLKAGRSILAQIGSSGVDFSFQPCLWANKVGWYTANGNSSTVSISGLGNTATGTATTRNCTSTNLFTSMRRVGYVSATTAGSSAGTRHGAQQFWAGNAPGLGGYMYVARFGISSAATVSGQRSFVGLLASTAALSNVNPSSNTSIAMLGFGVDSADSAWTFMHGNGTTVTKDTLTGTFPARNLSVSMFEARIYCKPNNAGTIYYSLEVLGGGSYYEGTATTTLPSATTFLSPQIWTNNGTTALACGIDVVTQYIETDN
ncbi:MAG: hypothetical protein E6R13_05425 [Spirochaetes bacterium]|nr:MAG: hypothetical protein E6R13_05425 [Spirochaetota bacterium]